VVVVVIGWGWKGVLVLRKGGGLWALGERTSFCFLWTRSGVISWKRQAFHQTLLAPLVSLLSQALSCLACPAYTTALVLALLFRLCL